MCEALHILPKVAEHMNIQKLEEQFGITFQDYNLVKQSFIHSSYVNEHRKENFLDNERLEFLGDAVLELGVSQYLYHQYPAMLEGEMTKLRAAIVCEASLANFALQLEMDQHILLGKGEEQSGGRNRPALLADVFESFLGALYIDQGYDQVITFLDSYVFPKISMGAFSHAMDYKTQLQEMVQQQKNQKIEYQIIEEKGPSHNKEFVAQVRINDQNYDVGVGRTKKEAEQRAAKNALDTFME